MKNKGLQWHIKKLIRQIVVTIHYWRLKITGGYVAHFGETTLLFRCEFLRPSRFTLAEGWWRNCNWASRECLRVRNNLRLGKFFSVFGGIASSKIEKIKDLECDGAVVRSPERTTQKDVAAFYLKAGMWRS